VPTTVVWPKRLAACSKVPRFKINIGYLGVAITDGAVDFLTRSLAVELAPIRVHTISPGVVDTGAWDSLGEGRRNAVRDDQHLPDRCDAEGRRRRTADLTFLAMGATHEETRWRSLFQ